MLKISTLLIPALLAASLSGCGAFRHYETKDADLVDVSYDAVDDLKARLTRKLPKHSLIIVTTLLNVDNLNKTSAFGRIVSDQIASAFHQSGYRIIGMEMPIDLFVMTEDGALQLSDDTKKLLNRYQAAVLVGGVYAPGKKNSYVSLRVIDTVTKNVISATDFSVPMGPDAKLLMTPKEVGSAGAREETVTETPKAETGSETAIDSEKSTTDSLE
jgi:hypothetical protein